MLRRFSLWLIAIIVSLLLTPAAFAKTPSAPTGVMATAGNAQVTVSWNGNGSTNYGVNRSTTSGGPYTRIATVNNITFSYTDTGLTNGKTYYYVVVAITSGGTSPNSSQVSATPQAPPPAPAGLTASVVNTNQVKLTWSAASTATSYAVWRAETTGGPYTAIATNLTTLTYTDTSPITNEANYYVVTGQNVGGNGAASNEASASPTGIPVAPRNFKATANFGSVTLNWTATPGASSYSIYRGTASGGEGTTPYAVVGNVTSFTDTNVTTGGSYFYKATATGSAGTSGYSAETNAVTLYCQPPATPIIQSTFGGGCEDVVQVDFPTSGTEIDEYRGTSPGTETLVNRYTNNGSTLISGLWTFYHTGLSNGTTYYYTYTMSVTCSNSAPAPSPMSNEMSVTPNTTAAPVIYRVTPNSNQVQITWEGQPGTCGSGYYVKRATASGGPYTTIYNMSFSNPTISSNYVYTDTTAVNGTTYYYVVSEYGNCGESANSAQVTATPEPPAPVPSTVSTVAGNRCVTVSWSASTGANGYNVYQNGSIIASNISATTFNVTGLSAESKYSYTVSSLINGGSESAQSAAAATYPYGYWREQQVVQGGGGSWPAGNHQCPGTGTWEIINPFGTSIANSISAAGWAVSDNASEVLSITSPASVPYSANYNIHANISPAPFCDSDAFDIVPLLSPQNVVATAGNAKVQLTWQAVAGATSYDVHRWTGASPTNSDYLPVVATTTSTSYLDSGLTPGQQYYYVITAVNNSGESVDSPVPCTPTSALLAPTGVTATASGTTINLTWSSVTNATSYTVNRATGSNGPWTAVATGVTPTSYSDTGLQGGTNYYYTVTAQDALDTSPVSNVVSALTAPAGPPTLTVTLNQSSQPVLAWNAIASATSYNVKRSSTSGSGYTTIANVTSTTYTDTSATVGGTYYYVISALNSGGETANSNEAEAQPIPAPTGVNETVGDMSIDLTWNPVNVPNCTIASYNIKRSTTSGGPYTIIENYPAGMNLSTDTCETFDYGLTNGTWYYYVISAVNGLGQEGPNSAEIGAVPTTPIPGIPQNLKAVPGDGTVQLAWSASSDAYTYNVMRSTDGVNFTQVSNNLQTTNFQDTGLTNGTTYWYEVSASNASGTGQPSSICSVTPAPATMTAAQAIQVATTFCQNIGQPDSNTAAAVYPGPLPLTGGLSGYYQPCWEVTFGSPATTVVYVADASGVVTYYFSYSLESQYEADTSAPATPIGDSNAISIANSTAGHSGVNQTELGTATDELIQISTPATNGGQEYQVTWPRQAGSYSVYGQYASATIHADTGAVLLYNLNFSTPPITAGNTVITSDQARATADSQMASISSNFGTYSFYAQGEQVVSPNNFWTTFDQAPIPGSTPVLAWAVQYGTLTPDGVLNVYIDANTGNVIGGSYGMVSRAYLHALKLHYTRKRKHAKTGKVAQALNGTHQHAASANDKRKKITSEHK